MPSNFIGDGYEESAYLAECPGVHGELRFTFRPCRYGERTCITEGVASAKGTKQEQLICGVLHKYLVKWDAVGSDGKPAALDVTTIANLKPLVIDKLFNCVMGYHGGDPDPTKADKAKADDAATELEALLTSRSVDDVRAEGDAKN